MNKLIDKLCINWLLNRKVPVIINLRINSDGIKPGYSFFCSVDSPEFKAVVYPRYKKHGGTE